MEELYLTSDSEGRLPILISFIHLIKFIKTKCKTKRGGKLKHYNINFREFFSYYPNKKFLNNLSEEDVRYLESYQIRQLNDKLIYDQCFIHALKQENLPH